MDPNTLFHFLEAANAKPAVYSHYTARELWTDEHTSAQMLSYHLNEQVDLSSRRAAFIEESTHWMSQRFDLSAGSRIADFGCGPGLYTSRFARTGAAVTGIDFSARSIEYAREFARDNGLNVHYELADYLEYQPEGRFDLITLIMCDYCALSPAQRAAMLAKFERMLAEEGRIVLDVYSLAAFAERTESFSCEKNQLNGFWSRAPYFAFVASFRYDDDKVSLDKYTIVDESRQWEIYNWLQYYTPETLELEARAAGLTVEAVYGDVAGNPYERESEEFAVVLKRLSDSA